MKRIDYTKLTNWLRESAAMSHRFMKMAAEDGDYLKAVEHKADKDAYDYLLGIIETDDEMIRPGFVEDDDGEER